LERLAQEPFDLVLMDLQMPRMDGVTAARTWRAKECDSGSRVPIVAMTAYPQDRGEAQCFEAGMDGYLLKPVSRESLKAAIVSARERVLTMTVSPRTCVGASVWPFDQTEMLERIGEDMSLLRELSELYSQAWPALIEKMRRQLSQREREALRRTAHAIKGLVGNFAAKSAYERARGIEFGAASTAWEDLEKECNELEGRVKELDFSLKTYLEKEPSRPIL
jgi:CheY-like chemotaxis protein